MNYLLYTLPGLLSLAACHSQTSPATTTHPAVAGPVPGPPTTVASSPGTAYRVYRGRLPGQADSITLHLVTAPRGEASGHFGSYYGADGRPYELQGQPSASPDSVVLFDTSPDKAPEASGPAPYWRLRRQPGRGDLAGTLGGQPVQLRLASGAGALSFAVRYFADSAAAFPQEAKSPVGHISLQALVPVGGPPAPRQALAASLLRDLRGDTAAGLPTQPLLAFYQAQRQQFFRQYREDATASRPAPTDTAGIGPYGPGLQYEDQTATYVLYQQGNLISIGIFKYSFSGGAHGSYGTTAASYDLRTGRPLRYDAIFGPAAAGRLPALLAQAVRQQLGIAATEPLDTQLLVKQLPVTHNVFLTAGGAEFIYQPYEIASYAQGEIRVFLPLAAIRPLLRAGLPLPEASGIAAR